MTTHQQRSAAAKDLARWLRRRFGSVVEDVRLYGSVARGTDGTESDIDVLILVSRSLTHDEREELSSRAYEIDLQHGTVTQCVVRTVEEWQRPEVQCGGLAREVGREGVAL
jgi:predicted nucleotidyltransferase